MSYSVNYSKKRNSKRGTMLVVVLGLLVALFVIGTSFSFVTLSERKAAANYLDRQRALDLALDGVEYSIARLRAEATQKHYEGIGPSIAGLDDSGKEYDARRYALHPLDGKDPATSWSKFSSRTSAATSGDGNWVDFNGDNNRGGDETSFGADKNEPLVTKTITGFGGDGINSNQVRNENVERSGDRNYGPSGTYEQLGDYFRVRAVDAASLLNINNYREDRLRQVLLTLGVSIDSWLNRGKPTGRDNPLPKEVVDEFMIVAENTQWIFNSKEQLRPIWQKFEGGDRMFEMAMNFITVNSWVDLSYRDYADSNNKVEEDPSINPLKLTEMEFNREGFCRSDTEGRDGWPDWQPNVSKTGKAPININTATLPVLVCLFANIEAKARLLFFQKQDQITQNDQLIKDKFNQDVPAQISGTTDFGRQNNKSDVSGTGIQGEGNWYPSGEDNRAIFQLVPIGPITSAVGDVGATSSSTGGQDYATALAMEVMRLRTMHPFMSWQDFDLRFFRGVLLGLEDFDRSQITVPDLIGVSRTNLNRNPQAVDNAYPKDLLPDAANCQHAANPIKSGDTAMTGSDFRAWYWKSCVDMLRAALCPSNLTSRYNADYPMHMNVDRMDLTVTSSPVCFSSMGIYEIVSQGEIMAPEGKRNAQATSSLPFDQRQPIARRQVRTTVQIYDIMRHNSQRDFASPVTDVDIKKNATSTGTGVPDAYCQLTKPNTKTGPFSIDELSSGIWQENDAGQTTYLAQLDDGKAIGYKKPKAGEPPGLNSPRDRVRGHNEYNVASTDCGWVCMNPRDETPWTQTRETNFPLTFHARFNESLNARTKSTQFPNVKVDGINSDQLARDEAWGHFPWEYDAAFDDFISTATPRSVEKALLAPSGAAGSNEFDSSASGEQATKYSSLMIDGVRLSGQHLRQRAEKSLKGTFGVRGLVRYPRLKVLRYPCGAGGSAIDARVNWLAPIRTTAAIGDPFLDQGVDDRAQVGYLDPGTTTSPGGTDENLMRQRLIGTSAPFRGTDQHNEDAEFNRQHRSNVPYYQGTVDFWIKWDLPAQGANTTTADMVVALGEIDPASHNFSGLFGCTAYGRFKDSLPHSDPDAPAMPRDDTADFEGVQFFVYKQPGGWLRFTRLYFMEAFGANIPSGATGTGPTSVVPFGRAMRRIFDAANPMGGYTATNDVCNDAGFGNDNLGFLYARTDAWLDMSQASWVGGAGLGKVIMRTHDWHRFTLSYNSNTEKPFLLWLDGRQVNGVAFFGDADINNPLGNRNDGRHAPLTDAIIPPDDPNQAEFDVYRTTTKILEINPEDRLTVGCITRRQVDLTQQAWYDEYFDNDPDQGDVDKPPRPVFKFDANFVAVANATLDDFRVTDQLLTDGVDLQPTEFQPFSRYMPANGQETYYENGFLPVSDEDNHLHALPVRLGTISWIELRPDWDPYRGRGLTLKTSSQIEMEWGVVDDYQSIKPGGSKYDLGNAKYRGSSGPREGGGVTDKDYWAEGGMTLNNAILPSGNRVGVLMYRAHFHAGKDLIVNNVTPYLLDVTITVLTPPRKLTFVIEY